MRPYAFLLFSFLLPLTQVLGKAQRTESTVQSDSAPAVTPPTVTIHSSTRMVTLEVVARDHEGRPATGLTANDFHLSEQAPGWRKEKREQKIAVFRALGGSEPTATDKQSLHLPDGVFSNLIAPQSRPGPPTILLMDGLNTDVAAQMQVHAQMIRMLRSLPTDRPVAVFLLGNRLSMVQSFTTDPTLLKAALLKASAGETNRFALSDPRNDPNALSSLMESPQSLPPDTLHDIQQFEEQTYAATVDLRVQETLDALTSIARHVAGYPGRKSLLWISSSFPLLLEPDFEELSAFRQYASQMQRVADILAEAKIAVYPVDPAGPQPQPFFQAGTPLRDSALRNPVQTLNADEQLRMNTEATMETVAEQTGGLVCANNNDLGDCIGKAVNDSNAFYEIAYYPDSPDWNGEFRKILVYTSRSDLNLSYRHGYYATAEGGSDLKGPIAELRQASCEDYLDATSVTVFVRTLPVNSPEQLRYLLAIVPSTISFTPTPDGEQQIKLTLAVCMLDKSGKPLQFMVQPITRKLGPKEYQSVLAMRGFPHMFEIAPKVKPSSVRLVVKDEATGQLGSVEIPVSMPGTAQKTQPALSAH